MKIIDTHAHLYLKHFDKDRAAMMQRALNNGITHVFLPNIDQSSIVGLYDLITTYPNHCFAMMGVHPCSITEDWKEELAIAKQALEEASHKFYAIGEIGLDYYWDTTFKKQQQAALREQISWAKAHKLPIVLHCRDAFDDLYQIVAEMNDEYLTGIFHCFVGTREEAQQIIDLGGFYMGIGGVVTHKKTTLPEVLQHIDLQHLVLETDSPYLVPAPYRYKKKANKRNESAYTRLVAEKLAEIKRVSLEEVAAITTENALRVFQLTQA